MKIKYTKWWKWNNTDENYEVILDTGVSLIGTNQKFKKTEKKNEQMKYCTLESVFLGGTFIKYPPLTVPLLAVSCAITLWHYGCDETPVSSWGDAATIAHNDSANITN